MAMGVLLLMLMLMHLQVGLGLGNGGLWQEFLRLPTENGGTKWALLIAGSKGYENYRHQADVCHAYQIMKKGGLKDQNIVVMMYDDIAYNPENPHKGDYNGNDVNKNNFLAVLLGKKSALTGAGSGKVISSGPNDHIFVYYSDHGSPGYVCMPSGGNLHANDLSQALKNKNAAGAYKNLVVYVEACESGSMFEGQLLPSNIGVYAMTASNATENSWATYCDTPEYNTCLGDLFSVAWMEDADARRPGDPETLGQLYDIVAKRTNLSHVSRYGDLSLSSQPVSLYYLPPGPGTSTASAVIDDEGRVGGVNQRDAGLVYLWRKYYEEKSVEAWERLLREMERRSRVDSSVDLIGDILLGDSSKKKLLHIRRPAGQPLVDDWDCLKSMVRTFEAHCGPLGQYGMKHTRAFANMCNAALDHNHMAKAASKACMHPPVITY
uniref:legumain n=1 Tax=Oryza rufipogon TaxID=4529 RepID=A0A0E0PSE7_ORYRU